MIKYSANNYISCNNEKHNLKYYNNFKYDYNFK